MPKNGSAALKLVPTIEETPAAPDVMANVPTGAPAKPADLSADASELWDLVVEQMRTSGLLRPLTAPALEIACETFAQWREAVRMRRQYGPLSETTQGMGQAPWVRIEQQAGKDFKGWCSEYGFTPAAERLLVSPSSDADDSNPFA